jgi:predicted nucleic acid-binding protein
MSGLPLVLDAGGLDALCANPPSDHLRALLAEAMIRERDVLAPTVVCAEVARGRRRTRALESAIARHDKRNGERPPLRLIDTDFDLARRVGAILAASRRGSECVVDAHVVAVCVPSGGALVVTEDADDIVHLAAAVPAARIRVTSPK